VLLHEFWHHVDTGLCGSASKAANDHEYADLNRHATYTENGELTEEFLLQQPETFQDAEANYSTYRSNASEALAEGDTAKYEQYSELAAQEIADVEMQTSYSYKNVREDKAELGPIVFEPYYYDEILDDRSPVRREKFLLLMTRLFEEIPQEVHSYAAVYGTTLHSDSQE
jgi:hypothetical protein